jgi:hypothetical protein
MEDTFTLLKIKLSIENDNYISAYYAIDGEDLDEEDYLRLKTGDYQIHEYEIVDVLKGGYWKDCDNEYAVFITIEDDEDYRDIEVYIDKSEMDRFWREKRLEMIL